MAEVAPVQPPQKISVAIALFWCHSCILILQELFFVALLDDVTNTFEDVFPEQHANFPPLQCQFMGLR